LAGLLDLDILATYLAYFSIYVSKCLKIGANDIDLLKSWSTSFFSTTSKYVKDLQKFLNHFKKYKDKYYIWIKNFLDLIKGILTTLGLVRDLVMVLNLMCYVLTKTESRSLSYNFSASELATLGIGATTNSKLDLGLISKVGTTIDTSELLKETLSTYTFSLIQLKTNLQIETTSALNLESQFKTDLATFITKTKEYDKTTMDFTEETLGEATMGNLQLSIKPGELITPQLAFNDVDISYSRLDSQVSQTIKEIIRRVYA
jgi:hypothetical protein